jgi:hypothetical protein
MEHKNEPASQQFNIEIPEGLDAVYTNFAVITHSPSEIIIDFARLLPNTPKGKVGARVVMTPLNAKLLYRALGTNLDNFETQFGEIKLPDPNLPENRGVGFRH